jgi:hypothetical protein
MKMQHNFVLIDNSLVLSAIALAKLIAIMEREVSLTIQSGVTEE